MAAGASCGGGRCVLRRIEDGRANPVGVAKPEFYEESVVAARNAAGVSSAAVGPNTSRCVPSLVNAQPKYPRGSTPIARQVAAMPSSVAVR